MSAVAFANAYFYSEKPLHARHTPHASARRLSLSVAGRAVDRRGSGRDEDTLSLNPHLESSTNIAPPPPQTRTRTAAATASQARGTRRTVRRVHVTTTSLPEYRTHSTSPERPHVESGADSHTDATVMMSPPISAFASQTSALVEETSTTAVARGAAASASPSSPHSLSPSARLAHVLYTPQGPRPLAPLQMSRVAGAARASMNPKADATSRATKAAAVSSVLTLSPFMMDTDTRVRCLYIKAARSQLLYIPPGTSVELSEGFNNAATTSLPPRRESVVAGAPATNSRRGSWAGSSPSLARKGERDGVKAGCRVLGIQLCVTPDPPEHTTTARESDSGAAEEEAPFIVTLECVFRGGRRLILSNRITEVTSAHEPLSSRGRSAADLAASARSSATGVAKVPLRCLRVRQWVVLYLDLETLQRSLFTPHGERADAPRELHALHVTCGARGACGVFVRRVVAMAALPPLAERVEFPLTEAGLSAPQRQLAAWLPDALRMPAISHADSASGTPLPASAVMPVYLVQTGHEASLTAVTDSRGPQSCTQVPTFAADQADCADDIIIPPPLPLAPQHSTNAMSVAQPSSPPPPPTALAQLRAMLKAEEDAYAQRLQAKAAVPLSPQHGETRHVSGVRTDVATPPLESSDTVNDAWPTASTSPITSASPDPAAPVRVPETMTRKTGRADRREDGHDNNDEEASEQFPVCHVVPGEGRAPAQHIVLNADPMSPCPTHTEEEGHEREEEEDMLAAMHDRIHHIHALLSSETAQASHSRRRASLSPQRLTGETPVPGAPSPTPRLASASPSEDKAVQTDAWCALDHVGGSRGRISHEDSLGMPGRTQFDHHGKSSLQLCPSHHYIPLSAIKDNDSRPPQTSSTFFARASNLFSDGSNDAMTRAALTGEGVEGHVPRLAQGRVLYHGDTPTPILSSLAPMPAVTPSASHSPADALPLAPSSQQLLFHGHDQHRNSATSAGLPQPLKHVSVPPRAVSPSQERSSTAASRQRSATSQGMTGSTNRDAATAHTVTSDRATSPWHFSPDPASSVRVEAVATAEGTEEPLTRRVLDFWSSTEHPLTAAQGPPPSMSSARSSRPGTSQSRRHHRRVHRPRASQQGEAHDRDEAPRLHSARHGDPTLTVSSLTESITAPQPPLLPHAAHDSEAAQRPSSTPDTHTHQRLVFNSAQYESSEPWTTVQEEGEAALPHNKDDDARTTTATPTATTTAADAMPADPVAAVVPMPAAYRPLPSHRSVFAKLRQHLAISSDSSTMEEASTTAAAWDHDDELEANIAPITVAELRTGRPAERETSPPQDDRDRSAPTDTSLLRSASPRSSWTFQSSSQLPDEVGDSITHPWASASLGGGGGVVGGERGWTESQWVSLVSYSRESEAEHAGISHAHHTPPDPSVLCGSSCASVHMGNSQLEQHRPVPRGASAAAAASAALAALHNNHNNTKALNQREEDTALMDGSAEAPPSPPQFSLYASGGPVALPPLPRPTSSSCAPVSDAPRSAVPAVRMSNSIARQREESAQRADELASHDTVRLGYAPGPSVWRDDDDDEQEEGLATDGSLASATRARESSPTAAPTAERRGTPLQWPLLRRSHLSSGGGGGGGGGSHPRIGSSRTTTDHTVPPPAARTGRVGAALAHDGGVSQSQASATPPRPPPAPASPLLGVAGRVEGETSGEGCAGGDAVEEASLSSPTPSAVRFAYLPPPGAPLSQSPHQCSEASPQALRYASAYSSCTSSSWHAPSALANGSTSEAATPAVMTPVSRTRAGGADVTPTPLHPHLHRHYSLPHLAQYHRLRSAGPIQVSPSQAAVQNRLARASSAAVPRVNAAPELLLARPTPTRDRSPSVTSTVATALADPPDVSGRYMYDPVLDSYLDRHAHVYVEAEDLEM